MSKKTVRNIALGTTLAAVAGYLAGILTAPKSGANTRKELKASASKGRTEAERQLRKLHGDLDDLMRKAKDKSADLNGKARTELNDLASAAEKAKDKVSNLLTAARRGKSTDADLQKAVKDATKALEHLRDYLSK